MSWYKIVKKHSFFFFGFVKETESESLNLFFSKTLKSKYRIFAVFVLSICFLSKEKICLRQVFLQNRIWVFLVFGFFYFQENKNSPFIQNCIELYRKVSIITFLFYNLFFWERETLIHFTINRNFLTISILIIFNIFFIPL